MAGKGLGTGLGALFGEAALRDAAEQKKTLPLSKIEPRQDQPRNVFDEDALLELSSSIAEHGVIQPLTVRALGDGYYQIIAGERRWRAARMAGLKEVPVYILEADDRETMELALVENLQREDLNPAEEARGYKALMDEYGLTQEEVANRIGKSRPVIANALRILTLPEEAVALVESGKLSTSLARTVLELEDAEKQLRAARYIVEHNLTVREAAVLVKKLAAEEEEPEKAEENDAVDYMAEVEKQLTRKLGRRVKIVSGRKKGRFEIEYYGSGDFENVLNALKSLSLGNGGKKG